MKILIPSYDFKPMLGGVANYVHEVASHLSVEHSQTVKVIARKMSGDLNFDSTVPYTVERIATAQMAFTSQWAFIKKLIKEIPHYDVIFCPLWFPDAMSVYFAQKILGSKKPVFIAVHASELFDVHNSLKTKVRHFFVSPLQKNIFNQCQGVLAVSRFTGDCVHEKLGIEKNKIHVINNGVNLKAFSPPLKKQTSNIFRLLTVTRLHPYKGVDTVLKSLSEVKKVNPNFMYTVIGSGPDKARLQEMTSRLGLESQVRFVGSCTQQEIVENYQTNDLFIMMSRYEHPDVEGFGLVFLEAAACKLASIGGNSGGIPDAIANNKTGWLLDPTDDKGLSHKLLELMAHPQEILQKNEAAWTAVQQRSWSTTCTQIRNIICEQ